MAPVVCATHYTRNFSYTESSLTFPRLIGVVTPVGQIRKLMLRESADISMVSVVVSERYVMEAMLPPIKGQSGWHWNC